ncbi:hypothetical protein CORT_0F00680 [Candida orthopsilosis Co 90-125]|uniref:Amino acid permease/ SLC12A domain-containing protein n=1 Tax=Candida orthopsilosis (strain 90-125) TaxID=1136231 RepID=H8X8Z9_CANO9|nr:hypothetical protein CORT_0F00680 [Candida orthopsilosis Co 90-125]CCG24297.1 hypothetical protein CORT_0F00680 [Candida orthopsilosis Co 90-125]
MNTEKKIDESELQFRDSSSSSTDEKQGFWSSFVDSFKPPIDEKAIQKIDNDVDEKATLTDVQKININSTNQDLRRELKTRHLQMISIGSSIGTGLFVGTGSALNTGGPGAIIIAWFITATAVFSTMQGLGELATTFPVSGSFNVFASRFVEPAVGFAVGWNYFLQYFTLLPLELVAAAITIQYWDSGVNSDVFVIIFWLAITFITLFGVKAFGEVEFVLSTLKILAVIGFVILGIVLIAGGGPTHEFVGGKYWHNPGPFAAGFKGVASCIVTAAFSYGGTEMVGLTASETSNVRQSLPRAIKQVFWRIVLFYFGSLIMISCLVPYNDKRLLGSSSVDASASAFTIAIINGGINGLPSVINAVILVSVLSVGNTAVYATSRTLKSLAEQGMAPKLVGYVDRSGRPIVAIGITNAFGLFALIAANNGAQESAFDWLLAISGLSSIFTWICINLSHIRFRAALKSQGRTTDELPFVAQSGIWGSYYGLVLNILFLVAQFWIALFPLGESPSAYNFFLNYLGFLVLVVSWVGYKIWKRNLKLYLPIEEIDVDTGRADVDTDLLKQEVELEREALAEKPFYIRCYRFWC